MIFDAWYHGLSYRNSYPTHTYTHAKNIVRKFREKKFFDSENFQPWWGYHGHVLTRKTIDLGFSVARGRKDIQMFYKVGNHMFPRYATILSWNHIFTKITLKTVNIQRWVMWKCENLAPWIRIESYHYQTWWVIRNYHKNHFEPLNELLAHQWTKIIFFETLLWTSLIRLYAILPGVLIFNGETLRSSITTHNCKTEKNCSRV